MDVQALLARLEASGFADLDGARVSAVFPVSDRLLNEILAAEVPPHPAVRELQIASMPGDRFRLQARLAAPSFLPPVAVTVLIVQQPEFPARPTLVLRLGAGMALLSRLGGLVGALDNLPPGVGLQDDLITVDLAALMTRQGLAALLPLIERLHIATIEGRVTVSLAAAVRQSGT